MRRLAAILAGVVALGVMCLSLPWDSFTCQPPACSQNSFSQIWMGFGPMLAVFLFYALVPGIILTSILVGVLRLRNAASPQDTAVRSALGETRSQSVRGAAKRGLADASVWVGGAFVITGVAHLVMIASTGAYPLTQDGGLWLTRLSDALAAAACLVLAHVIDAARRPRTPVDQLRPEDAEPRERRVSLARRSVILVVAAACALGVLVGTNMAFAGGNQVAPASTFVVTTIAVWVFTLSVIAFAWLVLFPLARDSGPRLVGWAGRAAERSGAQEVSAVLHVRSSTRWMAATRVLTVLAGLAFLFGISAQSQPNAAHAAYTPIAVGVPVGAAVNTGNDDESKDTEACTTDCESVEAKLADVEGVGAVVPAASVGVNDGINWTRVALVDPADLDGVDDVMADQLRDEPSVALVHTYETYLDVDTFDSLGVQVTGMRSLPADAPRTILNRAWVEAQEGALDSDYFYVYATQGSSVQQTADAVHVTGAGSGKYGFEYGGDTEWYGPGQGGGSEVLDSGDASLLILWMIVGVLVIAPIAAVAAAGVVRRRRDDATLAALGASVKALRISIVVESVVTGAAALAAGLLGGALTTMALSISFGALSGLSGMSTNYVLGDAFGTVMWGVLLAGFALGTLVFALVSWIASRALKKLSPVEALRPAEEGALR
ncbi:FtsX-like permease family protein [Demequina aurantiaca]|uniref:FtsX-like permease family protein n=1 Tax=Demequina aurantiaca TaxID=676200 RepID=UPI003D33617F